MLNGIGALRGLRDNAGLTDPTKWTIMSQWRNLGSKKDPKSYHCHSPGSVDTQTHTLAEEGEGVRLALGLCKESRWNGGVFS